MALYYVPPAKDRVVPSATAQRANALATDAVVAGGSREALEWQVRRELENPIHEKQRQAFEGQQLVVLSLLVLAFFMIAWGDWVISREMYAAKSKGMPWLPFILITCLTVYASVCIAETSSHFAIFSPVGEAAAEQGPVVTDAIKALYDERQKKTAGGWVIHPVTGYVIAITVLYGTFLLSQQRVDLQQGAGQDPAASFSFDVYLPTILSGFLILLGIPFAFWLTCLHGIARERWLRTAMAKAKRHEDTLRQAAIQHYTSYHHELSEYNTWAGQRQRPGAFVVPANKDLRRVLTEEWGFDPTQPGASQPDSPPAQAPSIPVDADKRAPAGGDGAPPQPERGSEQQPAPRSEPQAQQTQNDSSREADLLGLLDAQIAAQNRGF